MRITGSMIYDLYSPSLCEKRVYFKSKGTDESKPGPFEEMLLRLGERHEKQYLQSFPEHFDVSGLPPGERIGKTKELLESNTPTIYQGVLSTTISVRDSEIEIVGVPDFLIHDGSSYIIKDCKIARHAEEKRHPEIVAQLQVYGFLYESVTGKSPSRLEVLLGNNEPTEIPYEGEIFAMSIFERLHTVLSWEKVPYTPVGWSKCQPCCFREICWPEATKNDDIAVIVDVDQNLARTLVEMGISSPGDLLAKFDAKALSFLKRPWGRGIQKVGKKANSILNHARAKMEDKTILLGKIDLPISENYIMFDIEGLPPLIDELEKIYLWGMKVYGKKPSTFLMAASPFRPDGDETSWQEFLDICENLFNDYGEIPFIHWYSYESDKIKKYIERYGDPEGIASRVLSNLFDLFRITKNSLVLPEPSYSLKVVEKSAGFKRELDEYNGNVAMARYIEAVETEDEEEKEQLMSEIKRYNEEDLEATWAVFQWLKKLNE